jgi:transposase
MNDIPQTTIGVDLGDNKHHYCVLDQAGKPLAEGTLANTREGLSEMAARYPGARVAIEVGTHSPWISEHLVREGCEVFVANARKLRAVYENERKCDALDARMLAKIARLDPDLLSPVTHISQEAMADRIVLGIRGRLVEHRTALVQSVRFSLKSLGLRVASCSAPVFPKRVREALAGHADLLAGIEPVLTAVAAMSAAIVELDRQIERLGTEKYPVAQKLRQIPGVGPVTSLAFVLAVEDPSRIGATRDIGAYFGIVPRRDQSGDSDKSLSISKTGNAYVRTLLVQCAQHILGPHGPESDLRSFGLRLAERGGKAAKKKAIVAVARKLAVLLLSLWKSGEDYRPLRGASAV